MDYTCLVCSKILTNAKESEAHIKTHDVEELYFRSTNLFKKLIEYTIKLSDSQKQFVCQLCQLVVKTGKTTIIIHYSNHMGNFDIFLDRNLNRKFKQLRGLLEKIPDFPLDSSKKKPLKRYFVEGERNHPCAMCDGSYITVKVLGNHISHEHNRKKYNVYTITENNPIEGGIDTDYTCPICTEFLVDTEKTKAHIKTHDIQELYFRNTNIFTKLIEYTMKIKKSDTEFECQLCSSIMHTIAATIHHYSKHLACYSVFLDRDINKRFKKLKETLEKSTDNQATEAPRKILKTYYAEGERNHPCAMCDGIYTNRINLHAHIYHHHKKAIGIICDLCGVSLSSNWNFINHMKIHNNENNFHCDNCGKSYRTENHLVRHKRTHEKERPFKCDYCAKAFQAKSTLNKHRMIHTGESNFRCPICGKAFIQSSNMKVHLVSCKKRDFNEKQKQ